VECKPVLKTSFKLAETGLLSGQCSQDFTTEPPYTMFKSILF